MRGVIAVLVLVGAAAAQDRPADWKGELVVGKKYAKDITFGAWVNDKYESHPFRGRYPIRVRDDRDGWLRVNDGHHEGWVKKDEFVLSKDAPAYFTDRIRADPKDTFALWRRGVGWVDREEYDNAIKDFDEIIRIDPRRVDVYNARGVCRRLQEDWERAIADYDEAIRLEPKNAVALNNRGFVRRVTGELARAVKDHDEAIRLDPRFIDAYHDRGMTWLLAGDFDRATADLDEAIRLDPNGGLLAYHRAVALLLGRRPGAADGLRTALKLEANSDRVVSRATIAGSLAARSEKDDAAREWFLERAGKLKPVWPEPVARFLRGDLDEPGLMKLASTKTKETDARTYLGLDHALRGNREPGRVHFRWVKENGSRSSIEYTIAVVELARLEKGEPPKR